MRGLNVGSGKTPCHAVSVAQGFLRLHFPCQLCCSVGECVDGVTEGCGGTPETAPSVLARRRARAFFVFVLVSVTPGVPPSAPFAAAAAAVCSRCCCCCCSMTAVIGWCHWCGPFGVVACRCLRLLIQHPMLIDVRAIVTQLGRLLRDQFSSSRRAAQHLQRRCHRLDRIAVRALDDRLLLRPFISSSSPWCTASQWAHAWFVFVGCAVNLFGRSVVLRIGSDEAADNTSILWPHCSPVTVPTGDYSFAHFSVDWFHGSCPLIACLRFMLPSSI